MDMLNDCSKQLVENVEMEVKARNDFDIRRFDIKC